MGDDSTAPTIGEATMTDHSSVDDLSDGDVAGSLVDLLGIPADLDSHGGLRVMLASKCRQAGRAYLEVSNRNSTRACSSCGALTGPQGLRGLSVRVWACACGATHDRDVNAAVNTLKFGAALAHESVGDGAPEIRQVAHV